MAIILFTIVTVLGIAFFFRTSRTPTNDMSQATKREDCDGENCLEKVNESYISLAAAAVEPPPANQEKQLTLNELRMKFLESPYILDKFTIVTPTFQRNENLYRLLQNYCQHGNIIHKIIILWNNIGEPIPDNLTAATANCSIPVVVRKMEKNNLTSRFIPYPEIETLGELASHSLAIDSEWLIINKDVIITILLVGVVVVDNSVVLVVCV